LVKYQINFKKQLSGIWPDTEYKKKDIRCIPTGNRIQEQLHLEKDPVIDPEIDQEIDPGIDPEIDL
jgi:hypothetical protein